MVKIDDISSRIFAMFSARDHSLHCWSDDPYLSFTAKIYVPELGVADEWCFECEQSTLTHFRKAIYPVSGCPELLTIARNGLDLPITFYDP